jgi:hypothetical protein
MDEELPPLIYGSIIKIKTVNGKYDNQLFFIHFITKNRLELLSNLNMQEIVINIDDEGRFDDLEIEALQSLYIPNGGYAVQHGLNPGVKLDIHFNEPLEDNREVISGKITNVEEDMIEVVLEEDGTTEEQNIYIDFHYSGIDPEYNIKKLVIVKQSKSKSKENSEFFIDLKESEIERIRQVQKQKETEIKEFQTLGEEVIEDLGEEYVQVYSVEQQVDDYIEKCYDRKIHKKQILFDVGRYQQLLEKYVDLPNGIYHRSYTKQSIGNYFAKLRTPLVYPSTSYAYKQMMSEPEVISEEIIDIVDAYDNTIDNPMSSYNILLSEPLNILNNELDNYFKRENIVHTKQKKVPYHKFIRYPIRNRVYLNNYEPLQRSHNYAVNKTVMQVVPSYYTELEASSKLIVDGFIFPSKQKLENIQNLSPFTGLLDKSIQNLYPLVEKGNKKIKTKTAIENECELFNENSLQYFPFKEEDHKLNDYFQRLGISRKMIYECFKNEFSSHHSNYGILNYLNHYGIHDVDKNISLEMKRFITSNNKTYLKSKVDVKSKLLSKNMRGFNYKINHDSSVILQLDETYAMENKHLKSSSEILQNTIHDYHRLYMHVAENANQSLSIFDDVNNELPDILNNLEKEVQNYLLKIDSEGGNNDVERNVVKYYETTSDMMSDSGKIILKSIEGKNVYDIMYGKLVRDHQYNEDINTFVSKVKKILDSNDINTETHAELFTDNSVLKNLLMMIIEYKVGNNEKVLVKDKRVIYIFQDGDFIKEDLHNDSIKKKRVLSIRNRDMDFDEVKRIQVNDFVVNLVEDIKRKNKRKNEMKNMEYNEKFQYLRERNKRVKNIKFLEHTKYDREKNNLSKIFSLSGYLNNVEVSPFKGLFLYIISLEDSDDKYEYLQKFIQKFTHDTQDPNWLKCIKTNTDLVPKYYSKLIYAYLVAKNYDSIVDMICKTEGTINDTNDAWIHTSSGYILKKIEFDDSDIYDRNSMLNLGTTLLDIEDDDLEYLDELEDIDTVATKNMLNLKINKRIVMSDEEKQIDHLLLSFTGIMGIKIERVDDKYIMIKEINNIYKNSIFTKKQDNVVALTFSILGTLLAYIQCYDVTPKKSFPGCVNSFAGYPLDIDVENIDGIVYISCILHLISKKNPNLPYVKFSKNTKQEIFDKFMEFIQGNVISNNYVFNLISNARLNKLDRYREVSDDIRLPTVFKPSLGSIQLISDVSFPSDLPNLFDMYQSKKVEGMYLTKMLEAKIQELMITENPLLMTKYAQPFLVNFCCNDSIGNQRNLLEYLSRSGSSKEIIDLLRNIVKNKAQSTRIYQNVISTPCISIPSTEVRKSLSESSHSMLDTSTIYQYFIYHFNFDNTRDIPSHLRSFDIQKPSSMFYNRLDTLDKKIKVLKENGYDFTDNMMENVKTAINKHNIKRSQDEKSRTSNNKIPESIEYREFVNTFKNKSKNDIYRYLENGIRRNVDSYRKFIDRFNESSVKRASNVILNNILNNDMGGENHIQNMGNLHRHINYLMINVLPQVLLKDYKINPKFIVCKHWNLAPKHESLLKQHVVSYFDELYKHELPKMVISSVDDDDQSDTNIDMVQHVDAYRSFFQSFETYSPFISHDEFSDDNMLDLLFQKYLTVKVLNRYTLNNENDKKSYSLIDDSFMIKINKSIITYIEMIMKKTRVDYELIKKGVNNTKLSEKKMTTDYFKNMKRAQRMAEKTKMNLKLGIWAFALDKNRVYKYSKKYFDADRDEAIKVQKLVNDDYSTNNETIQVFSEIDDATEPMNIEQISIQEMEPMSNIPDEEFMDDADNYNY